MNPGERKLAIERARVAMRYAQSECEMAVRHCNLARSNLLDAERGAPAMALEMIGTSLHQSGRDLRRWWEVVNAMTARRLDENGSDVGNDGLTQNASAGTEAQ